MKKITIASLLLIMSTVAVAQPKLGTMKGMDMPATVPAKPNAAPEVTHQASGTVKKLDARTGYVTIDHGAVTTLGWPPMVMSFKVNDKKLLAKLAVDKKVDFGFVKEGTDYVLTTLR